MGRGGSKGSEDGGGGGGGGEWRMENRKEENSPSSFPNTLLTAPEHPPQLMLTLNL